MTIINPEVLESAEHHSDGPDAMRLLRQELAKANRELEKLRRDADFHLEIAARLHRSLFPSPINHPRIDVATRHVPVDTIGGEYCQVRFPFPTTCCMTMCRISGRGLGPFLLATRVSSEVRHFVLGGLRPAEMVESLNAFVFEHFPDFHDTAWTMSFAALRIELESQTISYSCAGHSGPLLLRGSQWAERRSQNAAIGSRRQILSDKPEHTRCCARGDRLLLYTQGLTESINAKGEHLDQGRLASIACNGRNHPRLAEHILEQQSQFRLGPPTHDTTLIVAELK